MSIHARLFLSSIAGLCFGFPLGWGIGWIAMSWLWGIIAGVFAGSILMLVVSRLMLRLPPTEPQQVARNGD